MLKKTDFVRKFSRWPLITGTECLAKVKNSLPIASRYSSRAICCLFFAKLYDFQFWNAWALPPCPPPRSTSEEAKTQKIGEGWVPGIMKRKRRRFPGNQLFTHNFVLYGGREKICVPPFFFIKVHRMTYIISKGQVESWPQVDINF